MQKQCILSHFTMNDLYWLWFGNDYLFGQCCSYTDLLGYNFWNIHVLFSVETMPVFVYQLAKVKNQ